VGSNNLKARYDELQYRLKERQQTICKLAIVAVTVVIIVWLTVPIWVSSESASIATELTETTRFLQYNPPTQALPREAYPDLFSHRKDSFSGFSFSNPDKTKVLTMLPVIWGPRFSSSD
jgi:hypothetical protein